MSHVIPNEHLNKHECPLAVIKCVDFRFRKSDQEFIEKCLGFDHFDLYAWPGSAKEVHKNNGFKASFIEKILEVSKNLHNVRKLLLLWHWDCGAYGGSKSFDSATEEENAYLADLNKIKDALREKLTVDIEILTAYSKPHPQGLEYVVLE